MTMQAAYPITTKHLPVGVNDQVRFYVTGCTVSTWVYVYRKRQGAADWTYLLQSSGNADASGNFSSVVQVLPKTDLDAQTNAGDYTGDLVEVKYEQGDERVIFTAIVTPGERQEYFNHLAATSVQDQEFNANLSVTRSSIEGTNINAATDVSTTPTGQCCPCVKSGEQGETPEDGAFPEGMLGPQIECGPIISRGLPLLFTTTPCSNETFVGPWGRHRSLGIYRKLFEQGTGLYGHISILRGDATRASYEKCRRSGAHGAGSGGRCPRAIGRRGEEIRGGSGTSGLTREGDWCTLEGREEEA
jgi:hypothetical protein